MSTGGHASAVVPPGARHVQGIDLHPTRARARARAVRVYFSQLEWELRRRDGAVRPGEAGVGMPLPPAGLAAVGLKPRLPVLPTGASPSQRPGRSLSPVTRCQ